MHIIPTHLSQVARYFIAGVLNHVASITALLNPTINSYKRLVPGYEAPTYICWGTNNRSALIRIPKTSTDLPETTRAELRSPDPSSNPYLAFLGLLGAGLDGIRQKSLLASVVKDNLYKISEEQIRDYDILLLPSSLNEALEELLDNDVICDFLGQELLDELIHLKRKELHSFNTTVTNWELNTYL